MNFPSLVSKRVQKQTVGIFGGLNQLEIINDNEFSDMKNIVSDFYPALGTRKARDKISTGGNVQGMYWKDALYVVRAGELWRIDVKNNNAAAKIATLSNTEKKMCGMGAYLVIYPDKKVYNTATKVMSNIEVVYTQSASLSVAPVSSGSTFIRITGGNIGKTFNKGDAVLLTGFTEWREKLNNKTKIIQEKTDNSITIIADGVTAFTQNKGVIIRRAAPSLQFICEHNNRLWGCSSNTHEIYASKLGDPLNWNCFEGLSTDSYTLTIGSDGDFTGCMAHNGYMVFFKEDYIHTIYGSKPSNFQLDTVQARGVAKGCEKSLARVGESIYYAARKDIMEFNGTIPESVSGKLNYRWTSAAGNQYNGKYYLWIRLENGDSKLIVNDIKKAREIGASSLWHAEDEIVIKHSVYAEGHLYIADGSNAVRNIYGDKEEDLIEWMLESGNIEEGTLDKKKVHRILFNVELAQNAIMEVYIKYDNSEIWERATGITADQRRTYRIPVKLKRCERYKYRLKGYGPMKLYGLSRVVGDASER